MGTAAGGGVGACPPPEGGITFPAAPPPAVAGVGVVAFLAPVSGRQSRRS
jgi:hypothetical protein